MTVSHADSPSSSFLGFNRRLLSLLLFSSRSSLATLPSSLAVFLSSVARSELNSRFHDQGTGRHRLCSKLAKLGGEPVRCVCVSKLQVSEGTR